jgi:hypothetical protein
MQTQEQKHWFYKVAPTVGLIIAMIFFVIGAFMTISTGIRLVLKITDYGMSKQDFATQCESETKFSFDPSEKQIQKYKTIEEIKACELEKFENQQKQEQNRKVGKIIDGSIFLLLGISFWLFFYRMWKK